MEIGRRGHGGTLSGCRAGPNAVGSQPMTTSWRFGTERDLDGIWDVFRIGFGAHERERQRWMHDLDPARTALIEGSRGEVAAAAHLRDFEQVFGARPVPLAGYSPVAVLPEHRGRGLGTAVTVAPYPDLRERGRVVAGLFPASVALYRGAGFEVGGSYVQRRLPAAHLRAIAEPASGLATVRRGGVDDLPAVHALYDRIARGREGAVLRDTTWWERRLPSTLDDLQLYVVEAAESGVLAGYAAYRHGPGRDPYDYSVVVSEVVAEDDAALRSLWRVVGSSGAQAPDVTIVGPAEDPLFLLLGETEPTAVRTETRWMVRLIDAAGAVAARGWNPLVRGRVDLAIHDPHAPWNDGRWVLEIDSGSGTLTPGGAGAVEVGISALSSWWVGYADATALRAAGRISCADDAQVHLMDHLCPRADLSLADFY